MTLALSGWSAETDKREQGEELNGRRSHMGTTYGHVWRHGVVLYLAELAVR